MFPYLTGPGWVKRWQFFQTVSLSQRMLSYFPETGEWQGVNVPTSQLKISLSLVRLGSKDSNFFWTLPWGGLSGRWDILSCCHLNRNYFVDFLAKKRYPGQVFMWARDYSQPGMLPGFNGGSLLLGDRGNKREGPWAMKTNGQPFTIQPEADTNYSRPVSFCSLFYSE